MPDTPLELSRGHGYAFNNHQDLAKAKTTAEQGVTQGARSAQDLAKTEHGAQSAQDLAKAEQGPRSAQQGRIGLADEPGIQQSRMFVRT